MKGPAIWENAAQNDLEGVQHELDEGANVDERGGNVDEQYTPLEIAIICEIHRRFKGRGCEAVVELLLQYGADHGVVSSWCEDPSIKSSRETMLHICAIHGEVDVARVLLRNGADANAKNDRGETPLYTSVYTSGFKHLYMSLDMVGVLLRNGANVDAKGTDGTVLNLCAGRGYTGLAELLLLHGADINNAENSASGFIEVSPSPSRALKGFRRTDTPRGA